MNFRAIGRPQMHFSAVAGRADGRSFPEDHYDGFQSSRRTQDIAEGFKGLGRGWNAYSPKEDDTVSSPGSPFGHVINKSAEGCPRSGQPLIIFRRDVVNWTYTAMIWNLFCYSCIDRYTVLPTYR